MSDETSDSRTSFGARLRWLMETHPQPDGRPWTPGSLAKALTAAGHRVSRQHIWKLLRDGAQPSFALVDAVADVFGVGVETFSERAEPELPAALYRAGELPPEQLAHLVQFVRFLESQVEHPHQDPDQ
ncbi:helix-turn-helix domain-containing protein [Actinopolyspora mortivallis]|uniref:helix-turn-helix domain-containing protein n=1 Tax=Actinopolyspora mortivallis TaxID=33906 RepID=UPI000371AA9C|nr:helix-turn-helix transcriptional regulator [Actinopolyspora mortivallis]